MVDTTLDSIIQLVARRTEIGFRAVKATVELLEQGATVPFIARYRKAFTGGMDEEQIREIAKAHKYFAELLQRKETILRSIEEQGKLTPDLKQKIENCHDATELEDLYLPYKPKRKTKAVIAVEQGLAPLAQIIKTVTDGNIEEICKQFINGDICTRKEAIQGAQYIIAEEITENAEVRAYVRTQMQREGKVCSKKKQTDHKEAYKFDLYEDAEFSVARIKPHQMLALNRGENLEILSVKVTADDEAFESFISRLYKINPKLIFYSEYLDAVRLALSRYLKPSIEREVRKVLKEVCDLHAVKVFSQNLRNLLLQPPLADKMVMGIDPGFASGCKVAIVNPQGDYLEGAIIYPVPPRNAFTEAEAIVLRLIQKHKVNLIAIGNGTASRETETFIAKVIKKHSLAVQYIIVSEAGASVYSASELAKKEFPHLEASERGNISIARRVLDPLAELVKIDPKSIGVGLYQHDVNQTLLEEELKAVVESSVNEVGVELNTASPTLLSYVSGLNERIANEIVNYRNKVGSIKNRKELLNVKGIGERTFEQAAGFLRIRNGVEPLDNTAIHPESYDKVRALAQELQYDLNSNMSALGFALAKMKKDRLQSLLAKTELDEHTFELIAQNLLKPGRDPREDVPPPILRSDVLKLDDLNEGMVLNGTVRNVVDFGAFIDIGLKNDALLHISRMGKNGRRVQNPLDVLEVGDIIQVKIERLEREKERVSLELV